MCKRMRVRLIDVVVCLALAAVWAVLAAPGAALAGKPDTPPGKDKDGGDDGASKDPVCIDFFNLEDNNPAFVTDDKGPYCDDKKEKVLAVITPWGVLHLDPNTKPGNLDPVRTLYVCVDTDPDNPGTSVELLEVRHFKVGAYMSDFDMRTMWYDEETGIGETRDDVNLHLLTYAPPDLTLIEGWYITFADAGQEQPPCDRTGATRATVTRTGTDTWEIEIDTTDKAHLAERTVDGEWICHDGDLVTVPPFRATVTRLP
jgi:hypothetical protein